MEEKLNQRFDHVNILVKIDEMKISGSSAKAFFEDTLYIIKNYNNMGHIAVVAHSKYSESVHSD